MNTDALSYERFLQEFVLAALNGRDGGGIEISDDYVIKAAHNAWVLIQARVKLTATRTV